MTNFFKSILHSAIIIAYREQFEEGMDAARNWKISKLQGNPDNVAFLYPELDVVIDLSGSTVTNYEELRQFWMDGLISQVHYKRVCNKYLIVFFRKRLLRLTLRTKTCPWRR